VLPRAAPSPFGTQNTTHLRRLSLAATYHLVFVAPARATHHSWIPHLVAASHFVSFACSNTVWDKSILTLAGCPPQICLGLGPYSASTVLLTIP
jgi:hypothetical protein